MGEEAIHYKYERRTLSDWAEQAWKGNVAITDFQRSFVWDSAKATKYIEAILKGKPVGLYLILKSSEKPQFESRMFNKMETQLSSAPELVLDGQQRLTSLMHALYGHPERRFFIQVQDWSGPDLKVEKVICETKNPSTGKTRKSLDDPAVAYGESLIPIDVLRREDNSRKDGLSPLANWCMGAAKEVKELQGDAGRRLEDWIRGLMDKCFFQRDLWYCVLPAETSADEAVDIFVATNTSSVKIRQFDIEVAKARGRAKARGGHAEDENLRNEIQDAYDQFERFRHYFHDDAEKYIPAIGEWMLKVACLHVNKPPKESNYSEAMEHLENSEAKGPSCGRDTRKRILEDLDWALERVESLGAPIERMVPSQPVLHVLAALREKEEGITKPAESNFARRLLDAYYWRCLFSDRHAAQANDRLHEDYSELLKALDKSGEDLHKAIAGITAFNKNEHPLFDQDQLKQKAGWIGGKSRVGRALASAVMTLENKPMEWMTNKALSANEVRKLQGKRKLDFHHVFPKAMLMNKVDQDLINNGLNGVVLDRSTNLHLWKIPPNEYVKKMLTELNKKSKETEEDLKKRIEGHLVPYEKLKNSQKSIQSWYEQYLSQRADMMAKKIIELSEPHP